MRLLLLGCSLLLGVVLWAQAPPVLPPILPGGNYHDANMVGIADLIIAGTVSRVTTSPTWPRWFEGTATMARPKVLKGTATGEVTFTFLTEKVPGGLNLKRGAKGVFFLRRDGQGFRVLGERNGVRGLDKAGAVADIVAAFPLTVAITSITPNLGNPLAGSLTMTVTNAGKYPVQCSVDNYLVLITLPKGPQVIAAPREIDIRGLPHLRDFTPVQPFTLQPGQQLSFTGYGVPFAAPRALVDDAQPLTRTVEMQVLLHARLQPPFTVTSTDTSLEFYAASPWKTFQATVPVVK